MKKAPNRAFFNDRIVQKMSERILLTKAVRDAKMKEKEGNNGQTQRKVF